MKIQNIRLYTALLVCALIGFFAGSASQSLMVGLATGGGLAFIGMHPKEAGALFMATPDTSALAAYAGVYKKELFSTLRARLTILNDFTVIPGIKAAMKLTKLTVKDGVRGYREQFDAADDDLSYSGRDLAVSLLKRDMLINPLKYRPTWMSEVMKPGVNVGDIPFAKFTNEAILQQVASEIQRGSYLAVKGDESTLAKTFDGPGTLIAKAITAETTTPGTGLVPVATGAITDTNAVAKYELMVASMSTEFIQDGFEVKSSWENARKYGADYRERYGKYQERNADGNFMIDGTAGKVVIKPCSWMGTSNRLIASPVDNLLVGVDGLGDQDNIITDIELEMIKYRILFALGFQIRDLGAIKVNDQA